MLAGVAVAVENPGLWRKSQRDWVDGRILFSGFLAAWWRLFNFYLIK